MSGSWLRAGWRKLPPVVRRDTELERQTRQIAELEAQLAAAPRAEAAPADSLHEHEARLSPASFRYQLSVLRRMAQDPDGHDPEVANPFRQLPFKLRAQRLAASHGIAVPQVFDVWPEPADIDLTGLPEEFVLKSDRGAGGKGVLAMHRVAPDGYRVSGHAEAWTAERAVEHLQTVVRTGKISGPYFAEELLRTPQGDPVTDDIKVYSCYGEVTQVLLRRVTDPTDPSTTRNRYLAADGTDLKAIAAGRAISADIPVPDSFAQAVEVARHLSRAVGLPFCRVDVYDTDSGIVLGEITRAPGGPQRYRARHDEAMGLAWENARWRLERDLARGRPFGILWGEHPAPNHYPEGHPSHDPTDLCWNRPVLPCGAWCDPD